MHSVHKLPCFAVFWYWWFYPYTLGSLHWYQGNFLSQSVNNNVIISKQQCTSKLSSYYVGCIAAMKGYYSETKTQSVSLCQYKAILPVGFPIIKMRWCLNCLIFLMRILYLFKLYWYWNPGYYFIHLFTFCYYTVLCCVQIIEHIMAWWLYSFVCTLHYLIITIMQMYLKVLNF